MEVPDQRLFDGVVPFLAVAEDLSFRRAASRLGLSVAAVSKAVAALEERVGTALLIRTTRAVALTASGKRFVHACSGVVATLRSAHRETLGQQSLDGVLRVSLSPVLVSALAPSLPRFFAQYPRIHLQLALSDELARLPADHIDIALRLGKLRDSALRTRTVGQTQWATVASPQYLARTAGPKTLEELHQIQAVVFKAPNGKPRSWTFWRNERQVEWKPSRVAIEVTDGRALLDLAVAGVGAVQVFRHMVTRALADQQLVELLPELAARGPPVNLVTTQQFAQSPLYQAFAGFAVEAMGQRPSEPKT